MPLTESQLADLLTTIGNAPRDSEVLDRCQEELRRHLASVPDGRVLPPPAQGVDEATIAKLYDEHRELFQDGRTFVHNLRVIAGAALSADAKAGANPPESPEGSQANEIGKGVRA